MTSKQSAVDLGNRKDAMDAFASLISDIRIGMLTTLAENGSLRSRPMLTTATTFDGDLWFFTEKDDAKVAEIVACSQVGISYTDAQNDRYVSVSGEAEIVDDNAKKELLWEEGFSRWFPDGREHVVLVKVSIHDGEYWDLHSNLMFKLGRWIRGMVHGNQRDQLEHEKIHLGSR